MSGTENILAAAGPSIALAGMLIVFTALALISLFIAALPRILRAVSRIWPEPEHTPSVPPPQENSSGEGSAGGIEPIVAAIGLALHHRAQRT
jgi:Na+-transporting methylmalonyl-CoA/oxaloacetate decarboxylase gamma subunit